jgi:CRP-like cAMP-binding protein
MSEEFVTPKYPKSKSAVQFIDNALADNFIFSGLNKEERLQLIHAMLADSAPEGTVIIQQGDIGDYFYVVEDGTISFVVDGNHVGSCSRGATFGELALLYDCPRAATCVAQSNCKIWKVDQKTFRHMLANNNASQKKDVLDVLKKITFLTDLDETTLIKIADAVATIKFDAGDRIITKGDIGEVFYIMKEGRVKVSDIGFGDSQYVDQVYGPGDFFGERALLTGEPRAATITAEVASVCLCLSREDFEKCLGPLQDLIDHAVKKRVLMGVPLFANSQFEPYEMDRLTDLVTEVTFQKGEVLAGEGQDAKQNLYLIRKGKITVANNNGMINTLSPGDYFGDKSIQAEDGTEEGKQTVTAEEESTCGVLTRNAIESVIGDISRLGKAVPPIASKLDRTIQFADLNKKRILGVGSFGKVWLVTNKPTGKPYALKMLNKWVIIGYHQVEGVIREKNIMASIDHPFVVDLRAVFQDDRHLYMLIELVQGGELFSVLHTDEADGVSNADARFYAACILESLSHLHHRRIAYRDLKPENVLIDATGYCILVDLGFAKIVKDKTYTLCGTPEYLAPEIILSKGHDKGVDYWAFGVLIYEMLVGVSPFYVYGSDQIFLFKRIVQGKYPAASSDINEAAQDLINRLLVGRQSNRFGCLARGCADIRDHEWFAEIDTDELLKKKIPAPWVPDIKDPLDSSHFDSYKHMEGEKPSNKPALTAKQQDLFKDF